MASCDLFTPKKFRDWHDQFGAELLPVPPTISVVAFRIHPIVDESARDGVDIGKFTCSNMSYIPRQVVFLAIASTLVGCSFFRGGPDQTQIEAAVKAVLPAYLDFSIDKTDSSEVSDKVYQISFKGTISPKEDLFVLADVAKEYQKRELDIPSQTLTPFGLPSLNPDTTPSLKLLSLAAPANQKFEVYGKCMAEYTVDKWEIGFTGFDSEPNIQGKPRSAYDADYLVVDSAEANAAFDKLIQHQKEITEKRQHFLDTILPSIPAGAVFEGQAVYEQKFGDPQNTQKIRIIFKDVSPDGKIVTALLSNPNDNMDWVPLQGKINIDPAVDTATPDSDPTKQFHLAYPIELVNDRDKASRRDQMRSWRFYTQIGVHFWLGIKDGQLVGKGGYALDQQAYDIQAQKK